MTTRPDSLIAAWLAAACADAERRGLGELKPLLESMARSTTALRDADAQLNALEEAGDSSIAPSKTDES